MLEVPIRPPGGARRVPDRPPLGLSPRRAVARRGRGRARSRVGGRRKPDLVCVTGDLVSHPRGEPHLRAAARHGSTGRTSCSATTTSRVTRDPFSRAAELEISRGRAPARRGGDVELRGRARPDRRRRPARRIRGGAPRPRELADPDADLRILLCHFPGVARKLPAGDVRPHPRRTPPRRPDLLPYPGGRLLLAHPRSRYVAGLYETGGGVMHVSPGTGTTFVPFRFCARPEVTELVLRRLQQSA